MQNVKRSFNTFEEPEKKQKESHNVYLAKKHWNFLDEIANHSGMSRNKALREILDSIMGEQDVRQ